MQRRRVLQPRVRHHPAAITQHTKLTFPLLFLQRPAVLMVYFHVAVYGMRVQRAAKGLGSNNGHKTNLLPLRCQPVERVLLFSAAHQTETWAVSIRGSVPQRMQFHCPIRMRELGRNELKTCA